VPLTSGFNHVATLTADMERLVGFYSSAFGADVLFEMAAKEDHPHMVILGLVLF
jgi:catechol 2,3-dioxygenase-like lactoylglutathione lyase family enzyme